ncbi:MAG: hypothetical protein J6W10_00430 [Kiritimatiellae bacterium]|nr:hypothetical protein [Kiritimatiellia bacterium]
MKDKRKKEKDSVYREKIAYAARLYRKALAMSTVNSFVETLKIAAEAYKTLEELRLKFGEDEYDHAPETVNCDFVHYLIVKYKGSNRPDSPEIFQNEEFVLDSWEWDVKENDFDYEG